MKVNGLKFMLCLLGGVAFSLLSSCDKPSNGEPSDSSPAQAADVETLQDEVDASDGANGESVDEPSTLAKETQKLAEEGSEALTRRVPLPTELGQKSELETMQPFVLKDLSSIKLPPGPDSPKVGDTIYTYTNLPKGKCGDFWVINDQGVVEPHSVCYGDGEEGHSH